MNDELRLSGILSGLYDCVIDPSQWPSALGEMSAFVGGSSALLFHQDFLRKSGNFIYSFNADPEWTRLYFEKYLPLNPVIPFTAFMEVGHTTSMSRVVNMEEFRSSTFFLEWAQPQNYLDVVVTILEKTATATGLFAVSGLDGLATEGQVARLGLIAPHLRRAVSITRMFDDLKREVVAFRAAVDSLADAVYFLDTGGRVVFENAAARNTATGTSPLRVANAQLIINDGQAAAAIRVAVKAAAVGNMAGGAATIDLGGADDRGTRWIGTVLPLAAGKHRQSAPADTAALLFVRRVGVDMPPPMETLAKLYGFTARELQVFFGIVQFGGVPEVARIYGLSPTTVRTHLQKLFDKTGVRRQADLARLAATAMPMPAGPPPVTP